MGYECRIHCLRSTRSLSHSIFDNKTTGSAIVTVETRYNIECMHLLKLFTGKRLVGSYDGSDDIRRGTSSACSRCRSHYKDEVHKQIRTRYQCLFASRLSPRTDCSPFQTGLSQLLCTSSVRANHLLTEFFDRPVLNTSAMPRFAGIFTAHVNAVFSVNHHHCGCLLYTSPSPRDLSTSRMPSSA